MSHKVLLGATSALAISALAFASIASAQAPRGGAAAPSVSPSANPGTPAGGAAAPSGSPGSSSVPAEKSSPTTESRGGAESEKATPGNAQRKDDAAPKSAQSPSRSGPATAESNDKNAQNDRRGNNAASKDQPAQKNGANEKADNPRAGTASGERNGNQTTGAAASGSRTNVTVNLNTEQRTRVRETVIRESNAPRAANVSFSINVGTVVPRTQRVAPLPATVVEIAPDWRGYDYFLVGDDIIIVEPGTLRIVAVLPA